MHGVISLTYATSQNYDKKVNKPTLFSRRLHCKSNSLHLNLFIAFILRAIISFIKSSLFVEGVGLEKDIRRIEGDIEFREEGSVSICKCYI